MTYLPWLFLILSFGFLVYHRFSRNVWFLLFGITLLASAIVDRAGPVFLVGGLLTLLWLSPLREKFVSKSILKFYKKILPPISDTEQIALEAGTVGFEGEIFSGKPNWDVLRGQAAPQLTDDEEAFLRGPVEEVCRMTNDWNVSHETLDLSEETWEFLKKNKFFGMIVPKEYGGLGFSAYAHHRVIEKLSSRSVALAVTVGVPNSLGPAELLMHYGTKGQKDYYLPRLAGGLEIPCFALTGPFAGSDATSIPDTGVVCRENWNGVETLGVRLTFDKRYITLAPKATLIGLAFRMLDPDGLLGDKKDIGISLALMPRDTEGLSIGRRHFPLNAAFQNGPLSGKNVFLPLSQMIGGLGQEGQGWRMLVECLSIGRSITLPSLSSGGARLTTLATGAYARIRKQFGLSVGRFEGVEEVLARMGGKTYAVTSLARATALAVDRGEKPAVPSAIAKYHCTEMGREIVRDAMDIHGGKGIILGPKNYLGRAWQYSPIGITVEGANIMTRTLMIFGQGAILCHPFVLKEMRAAKNPDEVSGLKEFDQAFSGHVAQVLSNAVRALWYGLTASKAGGAPGDSQTKKMYRKLNRYSACLSLFADAAMMTLGGRLKFKESLSGRLGDVLSHIYIAAQTIKRFEDEGSLKDDYPFLAWAFHNSANEIEKSLSAALRNFPNRFVATVLWCLIFPFGRRATPPSDQLGRRVASLLTSPSSFRERLGEHVYLTDDPTNPAGRVCLALDFVAQTEPLERRVAKWFKQEEDLFGLSFEDKLKKAQDSGIITNEETLDLIKNQKLTLDAITVDDFDSFDLVPKSSGNRGVVPPVVSAITSENSVAESSARPPSLNSCLLPRTS